MNVLHLNTDVTGGSFHAMARLHLSLSELGVQSHAVTRTMPVGFPERLLRRFETWLTEGNSNVFTQLRNPVSTPVSKLCGGAPDIVHLHWVSRWLDLPSLVRSLPESTPIFWTVHDFAAFTGGCHLHSGCEGFTRSCTHCPVVRAPFGHAISLPAKELAQKRRILEGRNLTVIGNSRWTSSYANRSRAFPSSTRFETLHPAFSPEAFVASDPTAARERFGLAGDLPVLGFGCASLSDENKRFGHFLRTAALVAERLPGLQLLVFGDHHDLPEAPPGTSLHHIGSLDSAPDLAAAYSAMDLFLVTSRVETFGQVSVEAQACGTPVCIFDAGGLSETIDPDKTGTVSPNGDVHHLAAEVTKLLQDRSRLAAFSEAASAWTRSQFSSSASASDHLALYQSALS